jgi:hypothetical protein
LNLYLTTIDFDSYLVPNVRASHEAAAQRWGADYRPMSEPWGPMAAKGVFGAKLDMGLLPFDRPCRVVYVDGDVLIRDDCPSLFDRVPAGRFGGVPNYQGDTHANPDRDHWPTWTRIADRLACDLPYDPLTYINGGVMVFDLADHAIVWPVAASIFADDDRVGPMQEQTSVNVVLRMLGIPRQMLEPGYNRLGASVWRPGPMPCFVSHLAHLGALRDRGDLLETIQWQRG